MNIKNGEIWYSASEYDALQSQRDELLEALISIKMELSAPNSYGPTQVSKVWHIACDTIAAIRRVEEGR